MSTKNTRWLIARWIAVVTIVSLTAPNGVRAAARGQVAEAPAPQRSTVEIMKIAHKKPEQLLKKVAIGQATAADKQELLNLYRALAANKPPKGDAASWDTKTKLLVAAAEAAVKGEKDAKAQLERAADCTACHNSHR